MRAGCKIYLLSTAFAVFPASICVSQTARPDPPSPAELRRLADRALENQHLNDQALYVYERIERVIVERPPQSNDVRPPLSEPRNETEQKITYDEPAALSKPPPRHWSA